MKKVMGSKMNLDIKGSKSSFLSVREILKVHTQLNNLTYLIQLYQVKTTEKNPPGLNPT